MTKLLLLGGCLGSGKTTSMIAGAKNLEEKGCKVSVITNDRGDFPVGYIVCPHGRSLC